jgi:cell division protein FtsI (penicillin-binding protein 3)
MANIKRDIRFRVYLAFIGICIFAIAIIWRAVALQVVSGPMLREMSLKEHTRIDTLEPERGNIFSEDGAMLSISIPQFDIHVDFGAIQKDTFITNVKALSKELALMFKDKSAADYELELKAQYKIKNRYYLLKRDVRYNDYIAMRKFSILKHGANKGGFMASDKIKRVNPFLLLANRTIGIYRENAQKVGLEGKYDAELCGAKGHRVETKIAGGTWMPIDGGELESKNGNDIVTTIDVNTQDIAENALLKVLTKEEAAFGTCIVMETKTGKIKAMANLGRQTDGSYIEDLNYAIRPIEPGSTFKINDLMSVIDDGLFTINDKVNCNGGVCYFANQKMSDSHLGTGNVTIREAFAHSSNVGCAKLIYNSYTTRPQDYIKHLQTMQIDKLTGIDLAGEIKPTFNVQMGNFKNPATLAWMAIGYELQVSPLRTAMVYNTIANNGKIMKPYLVSEIREFGQTIKKFEPVVLNNQVCKQTTIAQLKEAAFAVVEEGTGKALKNDVYTICGKTGTAQVADKGITYKDKVYHGSFVGFFPKEDPRYTICVVVRTKKGANNYYGGQIALPVFKEVADKLYANDIENHTAIQKSSNKSGINNNIKSTTGSKLLMLNKSLNLYSGFVNTTNIYNDVKIDSNGNATFIQSNVQKNIVPNVAGMGLRDAMQILEKAGLRVMSMGKGKVISQSKEAGMPFLKGEIINIALK